MSVESPRTSPAADVPALTACSLCSGETLGGRDERAGGQLDRLRSLEDRGVARLTLVECLDECERGDVVVARPSRRGRLADGRPVWFERLAGDALTGALERWLSAGGPGHAPLPDELTGCALRRSPDARDAARDDDARDAG